MGVMLAWAGAIGSWMHWIPIGLAIMTALFGLLAAIYSFISNLRKSNAEAVELKIRQIQLEQLQSGENTDPKI